MKKNKRIVTGIIISLIIIAAGVSLGSANISLGDTIRIVLHRVFGLPLGQGIDVRDVSIVWLLRLPRVLLAFFVGGSLAISGAVCQSVL